MGCYYSAPALHRRYVFILRPTVQAFAWGDPGRATGRVAAAVNGHYYGFRSSPINRRLVVNGYTVSADTLSDVTTTPLATRTILLCASDEDGFGRYYWAGRCALAYLTNGDLQDAEAAWFNLMLRDMLIKPLGRLRW